MFSQSLPTKYESLSIAQNSRRNLRRSGRLRKEGSSRGMGSRSRGAMQPADRSAHASAQSASCLCLRAGTGGEGWASGTSPLPTRQHPQSLLLQHHHPFVVVYQQRLVVECGISSARASRHTYRCSTQSPRFRVSVVECDLGLLFTDSSNDVNSAQWLRRSNFYDDATALLRFPPTLPVDFVAIA